ncbi:oxidoreductase [uncultured Sphingomonas sp.]|uniref:oxidoreductase n=1 Tax=uncultured Sphingomonas sp. TaxID=158754 RepID=UPI0025CED7C6|nr:oxidoreductase [uncultured Sphingomonas sp.]
MTINTALIGFGLAGAHFHAPLITATPRLALRNVVTSRADAVAAAYPDAVVAGNADVVFTDDSVELVVIATPNHTHAELARDALLAGKHVVIDKPFVVDAQEGRDLAALALARGRMLTVFHNRRWDGDFVTVRRLLGSGRLGDVRLVEMRWDRHRPAIKQGWREVPGEGSGLLSDLGPHLVDQAIALFGTPDHVAGDVASQRRDALVDDYFEVTLHYGAMRVILSSSSLVAATRPRFAVHGTAGSFVKYGLDPQEGLLRAGGLPAGETYGEDVPEYYGIIVYPDGTQERIRTERGDWRLFYSGVAETIRGGFPPPVDPADALVGMALLDCARRSAREGRLLRYNPRC